MELGVFYQFFQVQGYGHGAWKSLKTKVSARRAFLRVMDHAFAESDHCRRIALTYRVGRLLRG